MSAKRRMSERIKRDLSLDGYDPRYITDEVRSKVLAITQEFCTAPQEHKEEVYQAAERKLLRLLGSLPKCARAGSVAE